MISKIDPSLSVEKLKMMVEGQFFDRKSERISSRDFAHQLSAFANASGGCVAIGVEDDGRITGVSKENENTQQVFNEKDEQQNSKHSIDLNQDKLKEDLVKILDVSIEAIQID